MTREQAQEMYRDLKGRLYHGDTHHPDSASIFISGIMEFLKLDEDRAKEFDYACVHYGISEHQGGGLVV